MDDTQWLVKHPVHLRDEPTERVQLVMKAPRLLKGSFSNTYASEPEAWEAMRGLLAKQRDIALADLKLLSQPAYVSPTGTSYRVPQVLRDVRQTKAELTLKIAEKGLELCPDTE